MDVGQDGAQAVVAPPASGATVEGVFVRIPVYPVPHPTPTPRELTLARRRRDARAVRGRRRAGRAGACAAEGRVWGAAQSTINPSRFLGPFGA